MADRKMRAKRPTMSSPSSFIPAGYADFLAAIKQQIRQRQYRALRAVNHELVALYWELGESICRKQDELGWGRSVVENLARDLQAELPGSSGFSANNLWLMRQFYQEYHDKPILQPLVGEISWAKNVTILGRCKDDLAREFYLRATARFGWTKAVLRHQIDNQSYEKYLLGQTNFDQAAPDSVRRWRGGSGRNAATIDCCRKWRMRRGSGRCGGWGRDIREGRRRFDGRSAAPLN